MSAYVMSMFMCVCVCTHTYLPTYQCYLGIANSTFVSGTYVLFIYLFVYFDFTAATAADRPALSARAGWKKEKKE